MSNISKIFFFIIGLIAVIVIVVLSTHVGGIAIRNNVTDRSTIAVSISEPIIRGVPVMLRWTVNSKIKQPVTVNIRDNQEEKPVAQAELRAGAATIIVPCDITGPKNALIIRDSNTQEIIVAKEVTLLPPGPECLN